MIYDGAVRALARLMIAAFTAAVVASCFNVAAPLQEPSQGGSGAGSTTAMGGEGQPGGGGSIAGGWGGVAGMPDGCNDGELNGDETAIDCGGSCRKCFVGSTCLGADDCGSGHCADGICCASACSAPCEACNLTGSEGDCSLFPDGDDPDDECGVDACNGFGACRCGDGSINGDETDLDCGGTSCVDCDNGMLCTVGDDCISGGCVGSCGPWSVAFGGNSTDAVLGIAAGPQGDIVVTGRFIGQNWTLGMESFTTSTQTDGFVAMLSRSGVVAWARLIGGVDEDWGEAVAFDAQGNVYVAGRYTGVIDIDGHMTSAHGGFDVFVAKLDAASGSAMWVADFGSSGDDWPSDMAVRADGTQIWIGGQRDGAVLLAQLDAGGSVTQQTTFGSGGGDEALAIALDDALGRVYIAGTFSDSINFDGSTDLMANAVHDAFIASFDVSLSHRWSANYGSASATLMYGPDRANDIAVDGSGTVWVAGDVITGSMADFGGGPATPPGSNVDLWVAAYDDNAGGAHLSSQMFGGSGADRAYNVRIDDLGQVYLAGVTSSLTVGMDFGGGPIVTVGMSDHVLAKLSDGLHYQSHIHIGHPGLASQYRTSLTVDAMSGNVVLGGSFTDTIDVGAGAHVSIGGGRDNLLASFGPMP